MKAYYFEGEMGNKVIEKEIPENLKVEAEKYHNELIEKIVETDDAMMTEYLEGRNSKSRRLEENSSKSRNQQ